MMYDSRGEPIVVQSDPGLRCRCGYDNTPLDGAPPEKCEGCGRPL